MGGVCGISTKSPSFQILEEQVEEKIDGVGAAFE